MKRRTWVCENHSDEGCKGCDFYHHAYYVKFGFEAIKQVTLSTFGERLVEFFIAFNTNPDAPAGLGFSDEYQEAFIETVLAGGDSLINKIIDISDQRTANLIALRAVSDAFGEYLDG